MKWPNIGDEGGFAPELKSNEEACEVILEAITAAGYQPGKDLAIALDPAASSFFDDGVYNLNKSRQGQKTSADMTNLYEAWIDKYPIVSIFANPYRMSSPFHHWVFAEQQGR